MKQSLQPTIYVSSFMKVTPELLKKHHITGLLCDLDETLVGHNEQHISEELTAWLELLRENNIPVCIISNNTSARTSLFANRIGVPYIAMALKPFSRRMMRGIDVINRKPQEIAFVGDQIFTDIKAARNAGIKSILVDPMGNHQSKYVRLKRKREAKYKQELVKEE